MFQELKIKMYKNKGLLINKNVDLPKFNDQTFKYARIINSPFHIVRHKEMIHISPFLKKRLSFFFFNKIRKRSIP